MNDKIKIYVLNTTLSGSNQPENIKEVLMDVSKRRGLEIEVDAEIDHIDEVPQGYDIYIARYSDIPREDLRKLRGGDFEEFIYCKITGVAYDRKSGFNEDNADKAFDEFFLYKVGKSANRGKFLATD